ncbi:MAG: Fe2+-dicitrate sensor membrane [Prolixibacteraceae bacterium]|nr:MAG: Fe2+-dicitrate sensor membrane [Prolixibacteraceae bacterium]
MKEGHDIKSITEKYIKGKCTPEELEEALILFADPYHNLQLEPTLFEYWTNEEKSGTSEIPAEDLSIMLDKVHHRINLQQGQMPKSRMMKLILTVSKIAAILIIGLLLGLSVHYFKKAEPVYFTSIAPKGSVSQMVLPDNSIVYLNAGSQLKYTVEGLKGKREVFLDGEAWFDVTKNEKKPFVVHTPFYDVNVLGTQFNVKAYSNDDEISTTLEEGIVLITSSESLKLAETTVLQPGEQLVYNAQKKTINVKNVETRMFTAWKDNKLIFINMNLNELFVLLERKYGVDIQVTNNLILNYHYDGTIKNETILEVLDLLKETLPIKYKIEGQTILITKK